MLISTMSALTITPETPKIDGARDEIHAALAKSQYIAGHKNTTVLSDDEGRPLAFATSNRDGFVTICWANGCVHVVRHFDGENHVIIGTVQAEGFRPPQQVKPKTEAVSAG